MNIFQRRPFGGRTLGELLFATGALLLIPVAILAGVLVAC